MSKRSGSRLTASSALRFVVVLGVVNLFADMTYEGASSINGPFLGSLGASAATIAIVAGSGEFLGYVLRSFAGYVSDKTGRYWLMTFLGYAVNLLAVPALALAGNVPLAAALMIAERVGRAIRKPTVEAMLSYTTGTLGTGWPYALNNALDQLGGALGPLVIAGVLLLKGDFRTGYALLLVTALLALATLAVARFFFPDPSGLETGATKAPERGFSQAYWLYMAAGSCVAAGLMSFELISFHFSQTHVVADDAIPLLFAVAMGTDALSGLALGRWFDRQGIRAVLVAFLISACFAPLVFLGSGVGFAVAGMIFWGIGFGAQDTLLKALIASVLPRRSRNLAFGLFYVGYGGGWLVGGVTSGLLYGVSLVLLVVFSAALQLASLPLFIAGRRSAGSD